tara:strand:+ start:243 stop:377 length:135 start_codon:yes stop_codon:yes gene_type:complete
MPVLSAKEHLSALLIQKETPYALLAHKKPKLVLATLDAMLLEMI